ncbi:MAG TPA: DUF4331 domain-containing protein [Thermomicrobiales bacterium]|nr:DUF4331 domain-containing protein [Thermomicrobiales bacterium]
MRLTRLVSVLVVAGTMLGMMVAVGGASSHREAPLIANDPQVDNTDLYAWVDQTDPSKLNIVSLYNPFEMPAGFPNGFTFADDALYTINIDRDGDGRADLGYGFRFQTTIRNQDTFYSNLTLAGDLAVTSPDDPDLNIVQTYDLFASEGDKLPDGRGRGAKALLNDAYTSPNNVGPATHAGMNFADIMSQAVQTVPGHGKFWAGQSDDPFFVDLGAIWDLAQLRTITGANGGAGIDTVADFNAQAIVMQLEIPTVIGSGEALTGQDDPRAAVGVWASTYRKSLTILRPTVNSYNDELGSTSYESNRPLATGPWVQVSRLGMPLSNEVIILLRDKDKWNRTVPRADQRFEDYYLNSHLAVLLNAVHGTPGATENRNDLVAIFLTGIPGLNMVADNPEKAVKSDMLRINLAIPNSSFPNGRTLTDDVVDIELSVVGLSDGTFEGLMTSGISDGVDGNDVPFQDSFPFVPVPHAGFDFNPDSDGD